jgi:pSer/pThr/pTyr-binding forkhead associated (FHA) protein
MLKVSLIVVKGKPEGKEIPLETPVFIIGREEGCHLRPNSVEVSRKHTEILISEDSVIVRDLGSRNGTRVNGKVLKGPHTLRSGELLQVGPLTFAVSIRGGTETTEPPAQRPAVGAKPASLDEVPQAAIDSWLISDQKRPTPDRPSGVYDGETVTINAYNLGTDSAKPAEPDRQSIFDQLEFEPLEEGEGDSEAADEGADNLEGEEEAEDEQALQDEFFDENNPFHAAKRAAKDPKSAAAGPAGKAAGKQEFKDSSDAANDILRRMLERRRASR